VGSDRDSDVALIKISGVSGLEPLTLADSSTLVPGEPVIVVGNPFGIFETVTCGVISRTNGIIYSSIAGRWISNLVQYDAPTNPGNSGGPVFNQEGQVIGIAAYGYSTGEGVNLAISSNKVKRIANAIIDFGSFSNPILPGNWTISDLTPEIALDRGLDNTFGIIFNQASGVGQVQVNDIAIAVDGIQIQDFADLFSYIAEFKSVGDTITLTIVRNGTNIEADIILVEGWVE